MGGHGALTLALRHPELFQSVSAFAPIASPTRCAWGEKAFTAYLGDDRADGRSTTRRCCWSPARRQGSMTTFWWTRATGTNS